MEPANPPPTGGVPKSPDVSEAVFRANRRERRFAAYSKTNTSE